MLQKLVNLMNGVLTVKSKPGEGSVFEFTLPLSVPDVVYEKLSSCTKFTTEGQTKLDGMRVSLVDSNIVRQVLLFTFEDEDIFLGAKLLLKSLQPCEMLQWFTHLVLNTVGCDATILK